MAWKDELNNAKKVFKNGTPKEKFEYVLEYYKWHIIIVLFVIYMIGSIIYNNVTAKDYVLRGLFLNAFSEEETTQELEQNFISEFPIDTSTQEVFFDTSLYYTSYSPDENSEISYQTVQVLTARVAAGEIDFLIADDATLGEFCYSRYFYELSDILTEEQMEKYEPYFLYYDKAVLEELDNLDYTSEELTKISYPDPTRPDLMKDPVPVMINISSNDKLSGIYPDYSKDYAFAFVVNAANVEKSLEFLDYLME